MKTTPSQVNQTMHKFAYSAVGVDELGASEYTIVSIAQDTSSSVIDFKSEMEGTLKQIVDACQKSPRSENLLLRLIEFNDNTNELHGFKELSKIASADYDDALNPRGCTALHDSVQNCIEATETYAKQLTDMDYLCNAVVFIVTDGQENVSKIANPDMIRKTISTIRTNENLESLKVILVGVGTEQYILDDLEQFKNDAGLDQFVKMGEATPAKLAKLADFISRSISSTSQALGSGGTSQDLTF